MKYLKTIGYTELEAENYMYLLRNEFYLADLTHVLNANN